MSCLVFQLKYFNPKSNDFPITFHQCLCYNFLSLSQNFIEVHLNHTLVDLFLHYGCHCRRQNIHQGFRRKPVLGSLFVISNIGHVSEDLIGDSENIVDDFAKICLEVCGGVVKQLCLDSFREISFPRPSRPT